MIKVSDTDPRVGKMLASWELIDCLLGGTEAMRAAGERYMPRWSLEEDRDYKARLHLATLFPAFAQTIREQRGRAFANRVEFEESVPDWIKVEVWPDIDREDRDGHAFAMDWFSLGVAKGLAHVLVEAPPRIANGIEIRTRAQQQAAGLRPYCILIDPSRVLGWQVRDGRLSQLRVTWSREEPGEFGAETVPQIRVYELPETGTVYVRVFEKRRAQNGAHEWVEVEQIATELTMIPLATFYTGRTGFMTAEPPLRELAWLNAKHWAHQSSTDAITETAQIPLLAITGIDDSNQTIPIGSKSALKLPIGADAKYVEHSGKAIEAGREGLKALEEQMKAIGAKLIEPGSGAKTATQAGEEAAQSNSTLGGWIRAFGDAFAAMLDMIASYRGEQTGGRIELHADLDPDNAPNESMTVLARMNAQGVISNETLFNEGKRRGLISADAEWNDEQERIAMQGAGNLAMPSSDTASSNDPQSDNRAQGEDS